MVLTCSLRTPGTYHPWTQKQLMAHFLLPGLVTIHSNQRPIWRRHCLTAHDIMDNLLVTSFDVLVTNLYETVTLVPKHIHPAVSKFYTSDIMHFIQDEPYPHTDAFLVAETEDHVCSETELSSGANTESAPLHWSETYA